MTHADFLKSMHIQFLYYNIQSSLLFWKQHNGRVIQKPFNVKDIIYSN